MTEQELFRKVHDQVLDYDEELVSRCANWGYKISQILLKQGRYLVQAPTERAEQSSPFMYAVATAIIVSEFAKSAYNDYFDQETTIDLDLLDIDFEEIRGFLDDDVSPERLQFLQESNTVGLQDIWTAMCEWKTEIYKSLVEIYKEQGERDPDYRFFTSLLNIYKDTDEGGTLYRSMSDAQKMDAYGYVSNGFQY